LPHRPQKRSWLRRSCKIGWRRKRRYYRWFALYAAANLTPVSTQQEYCDANPVTLPAERLANFFCCWTMARLQAGRAVIPEILRWRCAEGRTHWDY
jgi:hypothetical protein